MSSFILLVAAIILLCLSLNKVSSKLGIPTLLAFIVLGMLFGTDGIIKIPFDNFEIAEQICSVSLIFIMFYGGFGTNWKQAKPGGGESGSPVHIGRIFYCGNCWGILSFCSEVCLLGKHADWRRHQFYRRRLRILNPTFQTTEFKR